jgi:hypothetical protein
MSILFSGKVDRSTRKKILGYILILFAIFAVAIYAISIRSTAWAGWWQYKIFTKTNEMVADQGEDSFIVTNYSAAFSAFMDNPVFGSGIAGFFGRYSDHEVHSTYIKMLGEAGFLGFFGYLIFMYFTFAKVFYHRKWLNEYSDYIRNFIPFFLGCLVSWSYTYHLRKREFWIMLAIVCLVSKCAGRRRDTTETGSTGNRSEL